MKPQHAYQQNRHVGVPRVDMILRLYDGVIDRLELALHADAENQSRCLAEAKVMVSGLAVGIDSQSDDVGRQFLRLYEYVLHCVEKGPTRISDALDVMRILRDGFQTVRAQAVEMERKGTIPPLDRSHAVQTLV